MPFATPLLVLAACATPAVQLELEGPNGAAWLDSAGASLPCGSVETTIRTSAWGRDSGFTALSALSPVANADRAEFLRPGITEWWLATAAGFEQGWTLDHAPAGEGDLRLDVLAAGSMVAGDDEVRLRCAGGELRVTGLLAEDATGRRLPARFAPMDGGFRVVVDDAGARYPVVIDPVYSSANTILDVGAGTVAAAGDLDGDGWDDIVVEDSYYVDVFAGQAGGISTAATTSFYLSGIDTIAGAGDTNADGYDDVVVGQSSGCCGEAWVFTGSASGLSSSGDYVVHHAYDIDFGQDVAGVGDVYGSGYSCVLVGSNDTTNTGAAYLYCAGGSSGITYSTWISATFEGEATGDYFAESVAGAGDVNGDGYADMIVGASGYGSSYTGRAYVYEGEVSSLSTTAATTLTGSASDQLGSDVAGAGDVNGDGYDDVIVGGSNSNSAWVFHGSASGVGTTAKSTLSGSGYFGFSVAGAGDVDADGYDDVIVGAFTDSGKAGGAYLYVGSASGVVTTADTSMTGDTAYDYYGWDVAGAGDPNGDGYADVLVAAPGYGGGAGRVYVHDGHEAWVDVDGDGYDTETDCDDADAAISPGAAEKCDAADVDEDCDGVADDDDSAATGTVSRWLDEDGDGYGGTTKVSLCDPGAEHVTNGDDCDDDSSGVHPGAVERCDDYGVDEDCDGLLNDGDPSVTATDTWYRDDDGDGFGGSTSVAACERPSGYDDVSTDCNDADPDVNPAANERCDDGDVDEDCDGTADDADPDARGQSTFYADDDGDGFPGDDTGKYCDAPDGWGDAPTDCDDADANAYPGATEVCDDADVDEDCDGAADDADGTATGQSTWFADADGDEWTDFTTSVDACEPPAGYLAASAEHDCDDGDATVHPEATDTTGDGVDQDCDGSDAAAAPPPSEGAPEETPAAACAAASGAANGWVLAALGLAARRRSRRR
ncbi:hypothetical protein LBMAG42_31870 [Deltaproteobacteria bacterium]|nr:hypothetical protein LBMAG42_31870 [Deltaproteobacteria bacterium]